LKTTEIIKTTSTGKAVANNTCDIKTVPLKTPALQTQLKIGSPNDKYEREADQMADQVMSIPDSAIQSQPIEEEEEELMPKIQMQIEEEEEPVQMKRMIQLQPVEEEEEMLQTKPLIQLQAIEEEEEMLQTKSKRGDSFASNVISRQINSSKGNGTSLQPNTNKFMSNALNTDFSDVKVHTGQNAMEMNQNLNARAFTHGRDIYFKKGEYNPTSTEGKRLLAHELTHVVQQNHGVNRTKSVSNMMVQRVVELRPPGRGEASAFDRVQELITRLNAISNSLEYRLDGRVLRYNVINEDTQSHFDSELRAYIDRSEIVPMRLITGAGYVSGGPLLVDSLQLGYVDLDDLLASDDLGFQSNIIHVLAERFAVRNYNRRLGTNSVGAEWARAHPVGLRAEATFFQNVFNDPSIRYSWDRTSPNGNYIAVFRSRAVGFRILLRIRGGRGEIRGTQISVRTRDGRTISANDFQIERAAQVAEP